MTCLAAFVLLLTACSSAAPGQGGDTGSPEGRIRIALGDIESVETLNLLVALERVRQRGIQVELNELSSEDLANQAVVSGQADIGLGAPYGLIQGVDAPIKIFCQLQTLRFFPVVDKQAYPDWQALDGETFTVHSRGSGTEAMARLVEKTEGIDFGEISYVSGSEVRATALLRGNVTATVLDIPNKNFVMDEAPGKFHVLPLPDLGASDEALFGNVDWMRENAELVQVLLDELLTVWNRIAEDPSWIAQERERLELLPDIPPELESEIQPYYEQAGDEGVFTRDCGGREAAQADFDFYTTAGQLEGQPGDLNVTDFWYLQPLRRAVPSAEETGN